MKLIQCLIALVGLVLSACSSPKVFQKSTAEFSVATVALSDSSLALLQSTNTTALRVMMSDARYGFGYFDGTKISRPLISPEDLQAREEALNTLIAFARTLEKIAAPDNQSLGEDFSKEVTSLTTSAQQLEAAIGKMKNSNTDGLQKKTGAIGALVASLGGAIINQQQTDAIVDAVLGSANDIETIATALNADMQLVFTSLRTNQIRMVTDAGQAFNVRLCAQPTADKSAKTCKALFDACKKGNFNYCRYINAKDRKAWPRKDREALAAAIDAMAGQLAAIDQSAAAYKATMKGFNRALKAMVKVAINVEDPQSLAAFASQMSSFLNQAATLTAEVKAVVKAFKKPTA